MNRPQGRFYFIPRFDMTEDHTIDEDYASELGMGDQEQARLAKLREIRDLGLDPYPPRAQRTHMAKDAIAAFDEWEAAYGGQESGAGGRGSEDGEQAGPPPLQVTLAGRLRLRRTGGKVTFA